MRDRRVTDLLMMRDAGMSLPESVDICLTEIERLNDRLSQGKIASAVMGVPGWSVSEPDATNSQIAHRIAREVIAVLQPKSTI